MGRLMSRTGAAVKAASATFTAASLSRLNARCLRRHRRAGAQAVREGRQLCRGGLRPNIEVERGGAVVEREESLENPAASRMSFHEWLGCPAPARPRWVCGVPVAEPLAGTS